MLLYAQYVVANLSLFLSVEAPVLNLHLKLTLTLILTLNTT